MQLKIGTDHAIRTILYIATNQTGIVTCTEICEQIHISQNYIYVTIAKLRKAGILATTPGVSGGCYLSRLPKDITLYDIITAMEGTIYLNRCLQPRGNCDSDEVDTCPIRKVYETFQNSMESFFTQITVDDLMNASFVSEAILPKIEWDESILDVQKGSMTAEEKLERLNYAFEMMPRKIREHCARTSMIAPRFCEKILEGSVGTELFHAMVPVASRVSICARFHDVGMHKLLMRSKQNVFGNSISGDERRYHPLLGMEFIRLIAKSSPLDCENEENWWQFMMECALCHHENWDGSGYPAGIAKEKIPLIARIMAIVNDYDHLRQNGLSAEETREHILTSGGKKYDPTLTQILFARSRVTKYESMRGNLDASNLT